MTNQDAIVFVMDDDPTFREALQGFVAAAGLRVELFGSAEEFLSSTRPHLPGCLVLGVRLPGMNGVELQRELAARQIKVPIIFITDCGSIEVSVQAMKAGAVDFLTKSCHPSELLDAIHQAVERDRAARQERAELLELRHRCPRSRRANSR